MGIFHPNSHHLTREAGVLTSEAAVLTLEVQDLTQKHQILTFGVKIRGGEPAVGILEDEILTFGVNALMFGVRALRVSVNEGGFPCKNG